MKKRCKNDSNAKIRAIVRGVASAFDLRLGGNRIDRFTKDSTEAALKRDLENIGKDMRVAMRRAASE